MFVATRKSKNRPWRPEDVQFAQCMQPSTVGNVFSCLYTVVVNRGFRGCFNYPVGISVLTTLNPSMRQVDGFEKVNVPETWSPAFLDFRQNS